MVAPAETSAVVWHRHPRLQLHWRDWGADSVVYDDRSGETRQFLPLAAAVMACFEERPLSADELAQSIAQDLGVVADNQLRSTLKAIVTQFQNLGWLVPTPNS